MTAVLISAWAMSGAAIAKGFTKDADWWRWIPLASVFGPMWLALVAEQRRVPFPAEDA